MRNEQDDLKKLADAFFDNLEDFDPFGIGTNPYRPFGNTDFQSDVLEIIGWDEEGDNLSYTDEQDDYAYELYMVKLIPYPGTDATPELLDIQIDRMFRQIGDFEIIEED